MAATVQNRWSRDTQSEKKNVDENCLPVQKNQKGRPLQLQLLTLRPQINLLLEKGGTSSKPD